MRYGELKTRHRFRKWSQFSAARSCQMPNVTMPTSLTTDSTDYLHGDDHVRRVNVSKTAPVERYQGNLRINQRYLLNCACLVNRSITVMLKTKSRGLKICNVSRLAPVKPPFHGIAIGPVFAAGVCLSMYPVLTRGWRYANLSLDVQISIINATCLDHLI